MIISKSAIFIFSPKDQGNIWWNVSDAVRNLYAGRKTARYRVYSKQYQLYTKQLFDHWEKTK